MLVWGYIFVVGGCVRVCVCMRACVCTYVVCVCACLSAQMQLDLEEPGSIQQIIDYCEWITHLHLDDDPPDIAQPKTPLEALHQRLDKYWDCLDSAKADGNGSKERRMGRIVRQYEDAIRAVQAGEQVDFSELPTPPGFPPIPVGEAAQR